MLHTVKCPTCRRPTAWQGNPFRPFCSARCRLIDLGAWATESYRIPGEQVDPTHTQDTSSAEDPASHGHSPDRSH
ncbi:MAG: DNA gyrase inhibitor YacG [Candidatus Binatia bacterium]|nr:DNA gyrase inhibitor YacG [Candidatus Binatia bacterium]